MKNRIEALERSSRVLAPILWESNCLDFGHFTLTSGKTSPYYVDLRLLPSHPKLFDTATDMATGLLEEVDLEFDRVCAVPTGGLPLGTLLAHKCESPLTYVRKKGKEHGEEQQIEGELDPGDRVLVVDDLITTGGSILTAIDALRSAGAEVNDCIVLLDRTQGGKENLAREDVKLHKVANIGPLVEELFNLNKISSSMRDEVKNYLQER